MLFLLLLPVYRPSCKDRFQKLKFNLGESCFKEVLYNCPVQLYLAFLTGHRYSDRRFIKWTRFCGDGQSA